MKDQLLWGCYGGCDCREQGHIHHNIVIQKTK